MSEDVATVDDAVETDTPEAAQERAEAGAYDQAAADALTDLEAEVIGAVAPEGGKGEEGSGEAETPDAEPETPAAEEEEPAETPETEPKKGRAAERIQELVSERKALETRLAEMEARLQAQEAAAANAPQDDFEPEWLAARSAEASGKGQEQRGAGDRVAQLENVIRTVAENPEGIEIGGKFHDAAALRQARAQAEVELARLRIEETVTREREAARLAEAVRATEAAVRADPEFAWMRQREAPEHKVAAQLLKEFPEIKRFPKWPEAIAILATGFAKRLSRGGAVSTNGQGSGATAAGSGTVAKQGDTTQNGTGTSGAAASPAAAGGGVQKRRPAAPIVGAGQAGSAPRAAGTAGRRAQEQQGRAASQRLKQAVESGDLEGELGALGDLLEAGGVT